MKFSFLFLATSLIGFLLFIRFSGGSFGDSSQTIIGYDEARGGFQFFEKKQHQLNGIDGPYIVGKQVYRINANNELLKAALQREDSLRVYVNNASHDSFSLVLKSNIEKQNDSYEMPSRLVAISDIEGNFNAFASFLQSNQVIDAEYNWSFGDGHLVLNGDFVDRGENVMAVLWLIYKLEGQAEAAGGKVHYILGNHEIMNFLGNVDYNHSKYIRAAQLISQKEDPAEAGKYMYSSRTEIGKWLRSKNVIEKIGDYIFVHAGLSPKLLAFDLSIARINNLVGAYWDIDLSKQPGPDKETHFLLGAEGPYWYRGLAMDYKDYKRITETELDAVLKYYKAGTIVFGHTVVNDVTSDFNGRLINIDLKHGLEKNSGKTKGILIENNVVYKIDDTGSRVRTNI